MMKISTEIYSAAQLVGEEKAVEYIAKAGFDAWDFSMFSMCKFDWKTRQFTQSDHPLAGRDYPAFARRLRKIGEDNGIVCNQSHAPFPSLLPDIFDYLKRSIECTAEAGGEICIIHPDNDKTPEQNAEMYFELLPFAKSCGVKIATENMFNWDKENDKPLFAACCNPESFRAHLDAVDDDSFAACLDIGHAEMRPLGTSAVQMIAALGDKLCALHIHDNDQRHDLHEIPFSHNIDFQQVIDALRKIGYKGYFTLEADSYLRRYTAETAYDGVTALYQSAKRLADMY